VRTLKLGSFAYDTKAVPLLRECRYVCFVTTDKPIAYPKRASRIAYIGKTVARADYALSCLGAVLADEYMSDGIGTSHLGAPLAVTLVDVGKNLSPEDVGLALIFLFHDLHGEAPACNDPKVAKGKQGRLQRILASGHTSREELTSLITSLR
jgi:hypothetical protein